MNNDEFFDTQQEWGSFIDLVVAKNITSTKPAIRGLMWKAFKAKLQNNRTFYSFSSNLEAIQDNLLPKLLTLFIATIPNYSDSILFSALSALYESANKSDKYSLFDNPFTIVISKLLSKDFLSNMYSFLFFFIFNSSRLDPHISLTLIEWTSFLLKSFLKNDQLESIHSSASFKLILDIHILALDSIAVFASSSITAKYTKIFNSAKIKAKIIFLSSNVVKILSSLLLNSLPNSSATISTFLGLFVEVKISRFDGLSDGEITSIFQFYKDVILSSKVPVPSVYLDSLDLFMSNVLSESQFKELLSVADRLLLRSPEVSLNDHFKSSNAVVRSDASLLFEYLCSKTNEETLIIKSLESLLKTIGQVSTMDQKTFYFGVMEKIPFSLPVSKCMVELLPPLIFKESNPLILNSLFSILGGNIRDYMKDAAADSKFIRASVFPTLLKGLGETKHLLRNGFLFCLSTGFFSRESLEFLGIENVVKLAEKAVKAVENVQGTGIGLLDSKKDTPFFSEMSFGLNWLLFANQWAVDSKNAQIEKMMTESKPLQIVFSPCGDKSILFNEKFYGKLISTEEEELAFSSLIIQFLTDEKFAKFLKDDSTFANAFLFSVIHVQFTNARKFILEKVHSLVILDNPNFLRRLLSLVQCSLQFVFEQNSSNEELSMWNDLPIRSSCSRGVRIFQFLECLVPKIDSDNTKVSEISRKNIVLDLVIPSCHKIVTSVMGNDVWVRFCIRAGLNPKLIIEQSGPKLITQWLMETEGLGTSNVIVSGVLSAITLFTSIAPRVVFPVMVPWIASEFNNQLVSNITAPDMEIWKTLPGQLCFDPTKNQKNSKTTEKSKELARATGKAINTVSSKAQKMEKELIQTQLEKEKEIRSMVQSIHQKLCLCCDVLNSLLDGILFSFSEDGPVVFRSFVTKIMDSLLTVICREMIVLNESTIPVVFLGKKSIDLFSKIGVASGQNISTFINPRPTLPMLILEAIGVRVNDEAGVPCVFESKDLSKSIKTFFESISSTYSKSSPWVVESFAFTFLLCKAVIMREGRIKLFSERVIADLSIGVSEFLFTHCSQGLEGGLPGSKMIRCLVKLLSVYPKLHKNARSALLAFCMSAGESTRENGDSSDELVETILECLLDSEEIVRDSCLQSLKYLYVSNELTHRFALGVFVLKHDESDIIRTEAQELWDDWNPVYVMKKDTINDILDLIVYDIPVIYQSAGRALATLLETYLDDVDVTLSKLYGIYAIESAPIVPKFDVYGILIPESVNKADEWRSRMGIAFSLKSCSSLIENPDNLFKFLIDYEALGDRNENVRKSMLDSGLSALKFSGKANVTNLLKVFDAYLSKPAKPSEVHDRVRENVVILLGTLAQHLSPADPLMPEVVSKLLDALKTPSETVQIAVADCLSPLIKLIPEKIGGLIVVLLDQLLNGSKYAEKKGAAYGLAGLVKGGGMATIKTYSIMSKLKDAVEDKKNSIRREGALFAYETLSQTLGRLFEPYVIQILPLLLNCYGDSSKDVREATDYACRAIMSKLSGHCVKLVLPSLLKGLDTDNWRTKLGSVEVLGSMAFLAPKQLSMSLPQVVPHLTDALADTHAKVQAAAQTALNNFGLVIKNPEIQSLVPVLIQALVDPTKKTNAVLVALLEMSFVHYIDAPSLALIVPILERGLKERSTDVKRRSTQIMGNMASLTDKKDLIPYLNVLLPGLKDVLVDPVPDARATAAKALGLMVERLGEESFPGLVSELVTTLKSDTSSVDRSGASQGLSEVLSGLGPERLEGLLPEIVLNAQSEKTYVREGFMTLLIYLPATHGDRFQAYLSQIIPPILHGLADEYETVRDSSLKAAKMIVRNYATSAIDLLLPELETGLFDETWRIRQSSLQLMGDLLFRISGVNKAVEEGEDPDASQAESSRKALVKALGIDRYYSILSCLYIVRSDTHGAVRQSSLHVWKTIVSNTPKTLKDMLPTLMDSIILLLASISAEKRGVAARTLGELVRKMGENILFQIVPFLEKSLKSTNAEARQGVCIGMSEIMSSSGKVQVADFALQCIPGVRIALIDEEPNVREAAALAFDMLHHHLGAKAIDEVLPSLLSELKSGSDVVGQTNFALEALKEIMAVRSNAVFPVLIPTLITKPITVFNARALGSLISVAGSSLNKRLGAIVPGLIKGLDQTNGAANDIRDALKILMISVSGDGISLLMLLFEEFLAERTPKQRQSACELAAIFFGQNESDHSEYHIDWFSRMMALLQVNEKKSIDIDTVKAAWSCLDCISKRISKDDLERFVIPCRKSIAGLIENLLETESISGFDLPKGISPFLPIFIHGLTFGSTDIRIQSALGLGDLIKRTSVLSLRVYVTQITGPLIRVIGDRFPHGVKNAILETIVCILDKVPLLLKPFLPQLQRTFIKCLSEPYVLVREKSAQCLSVLITMQPRLDPLVAELVQGIKAADDKGIKEAMLEAVSGLLKVVASDDSKNIAVVSKSLIRELVFEILFDSKDIKRSMRVVSAKCFAGLFLYDTQAESQELLSILLKHDKSTVLGQLAVLYAFDQIFRASPQSIHKLGVITDVVNLIQKFIISENIEVMEVCINISDKILFQEDYLVEKVYSVLVPCIISTVSSTSTNSEVKREAILVLKTLSKNNHDIASQFLSILIPALMTCIRDRVIPVKLAAERALFYALKINQEEEVLTMYLSTLEGAAVRSVGDYCKRVLMKLELEEDVEK